MCEDLVSQINDPVKRIPDDILVFFDKVVTHVQEARPFQDPVSDTEWSQVYRLSVLDDQRRLLKTKEFTGRGWRGEKGRTFIVFWTLELIIPPSQMFLVIISVETYRFAL